MYRRGKCAYAVALCPRHSSTSARTGQGVVAVAAVVVIAAVLARLTLSHGTGAVVLFGPRATTRSGIHAGRLMQPRPARRKG